MLESMLKPLVSLLGPIQNLSKDKRELRDNALRSISHALNETYLYYSGLEKGNARDPDIEKQLSNYWAAAAIPIRHLDQNLSMTCEHKAHYWINPDNWDENQIQESGIALDGVRHQYRNLLAPNAKLVKIEPKIT